MDAYALIKRLIVEEAIDCEFRECGYLDVAWAPSHADHFRAEVDVLARFGIDAEFVPRSASTRRSGPSATSAASSSRRAGCSIPASTSPGSQRLPTAPGRTSTKASAPRRSVGSPMAGSSSRPSRGAILAKDVVVGTNGYTDGVVPSLRRRVIPIGSYIIATEPLPEELARILSPKGRAFFDTKNFLYYWHVSEDRRMIFGGRASFLPTSVDRTAAILHKGMLEVHPQLAGYRVEYAWGGNVGFTFDRMPHVGRKDGITYAMGCCGTGVALMTALGTAVGDGWAADPRRLSRSSRSRSCRRRTRAGRGSCRSPASGSGSRTSWRGDPATEPIAPSRSRRP